MWCDGTAAPNPGALGLGIVFESPDGTRRLDSIRLPHGCNNTAEIQALMRGLTLAREARIRSLHIYSDSDFVVRHVLGQQHTEVERLKILVAQARALMAHFEQVTLEWIPRHRNGEADALARAVLGLTPKPAKRPVSLKRGRDARRLT